MLNRSLTVAALFGTALAFGSLPIVAQTTTGAIVLQDVRLIDGRGLPPADHASILIRNGKIAQIVAGNAARNWPQDARVLKLSGKTVIPGLINGHGHLGLVKGTSVSPANYTSGMIEQQLDQYERYGITTMISLGMNRDLLYELRAAQEKGSFYGTTILTADRGIGIPGGVPGVNVGPDQLYRPVTPDDARKAVQDIAARSPNLIKIWVDDNLHKLPAPNPAVYAAAIEEAHRLHLKVAAFLPTVSGTSRSTPTP
jgi:imidazolonepropionase-like amidohydrolase